MCLASAALLTLCGATSFLTQQNTVMSCMHATVRVMSWYRHDLCMSTSQFQSEAAEKFTERERQWHDI